MGKALTPMVIAGLFSLSFFVLAAFGQKPSLCEENQFYSLAKKKCQNCDCNPLGSATLQCDELGICE